jgi:SulP family sulfate permease
MGQRDGFGRERGVDILGMTGIGAGLRGWRPRDLGRDIPAGLAVAAVGLPTSLAYPAIAGLPPETGLYAAILPPLAYALFGPSRRLIVGPDAAVMTVLAGVLASVLTAMPAGTDRAGATALIALGVGVLCLLARLLSLGVLSVFLSRPILKGFFAGLAAAVAVGQIGRMTGVPVAADGVTAELAGIAGRLDEVHGATLAVGLGTLGLIWGLRAAAPRVPGAVVALAVAVAVSVVWDLAGRGVAVVGAVGGSLPRLSLPPLAHLPLAEVALGAGAVFLVMSSAGLLTAKGFAALTDDRVDANRELQGFGAANIAAGLFGAIPVGASDSRTAVNIAAGGRTQAAGIVAALALAAGVLWAGDLLGHLPEPALGAVLIATAAGMVDFRGLARLWRVSRAEFGVAMIAFAGPVGFGVLNGVLVALAATFAHLIWETMRPQIAELGRIAGEPGFYKLHRHPQAAPVPGLRVLLVEGSPIFVNADHIFDRVIEMTAPEERGEVVLLVARGMTQVDATGAEMLVALARALDRRGQALVLAEVNAPVSRELEAAGLTGVRLFESLSEAVAVLERGGGGDGGGVRTAAAADVIPDR